MKKSLFILLLFAIFFTNSFAQEACKAKRAGCCDNPGASCCDSIPADSMSIDAAFQACVAMRDAVAPLVRAEKTHAENAEPKPHAESADGAE